MAWLKGVLLLMCGVLVQDNIEDSQQCPGRPRRRTWLWLSGGCELRNETGITLRHAHSGVKILGRQGESKREAPGHHRAGSLRAQIRPRPRSCPPRPRLSSALELLEVGAAGLCGVPVHYCFALLSHASRLIRG